jgi:hypothetical protein
MTRLALALVGLVACKDAVSHIYPGRRYDPARKCVESTTSIDVVEGSDPGSACAPTCIVSPPSSKGDTTIYVSKECPPYPPLFDTSGRPPGCDEAVRAYTAGCACASDAGSCANDAATE